MVSVSACRRGEGHGCAVCGAAHFSETSLRRVCVAGLSLLPMASLWMTTIACTVPSALSLSCKSCGRVPSQ
eukprot:1837351-Prymnesium_polylepis.1